MIATVFSAPCGRLFGVRSRLWFPVFLALLCHALTAGVAPVTAAPPRQVSREESSLDQVKSSLERLQAQDPEVSDIAPWERIASRFLRLLEGSSARGTAIEVYCIVGDLYAKVYEKRGFTPALSKATFYYERLSKEFQGDKRVPPRLLRLGDLRRTGLQDEPAARSAYFELLDVYPKSAEAVVARARVGGDSPEDSAVQAAKKTEPGEKADAGANVPEEHAAAAATPMPTARPVLREEAPDSSQEIFKSDAPVKRPTIVIDPGHGGEEVGALGPDGLLEKQVTLAVAELLEELLQERLRAKTVLTRREDRTLSLADRTRIANDQKADLFVSIHCNASEYKTARGIETYYLDNTDDKSSLKLAERENISQARSGNDVAFIISDFIQNAKLSESISLAHHIQNHVVKTVGRYYQDVKDLGVKKAPFYVLVGAHMPCILAEVSFIDHPVEGARLGTRRYQRTVALGIFQGVKSYFEQQGK